MASSPMELNSNTLIYSETEMPCGTWIDGKTIYKKTFKGTSSGGVYSVNIQECSIDQLIKVEFIIKNTNGSGDVTFGAYYYGSSDYQAPYMPSNKREINLRSGSDYAYGSYYLTVYYTKTST